MSSLYARFIRGPAACALLFGLFIASAQDDPKLRVKVVHDLAKGGANNVPRIEPYLNDSEITVRIEAVKALVDIGTQRSLEPLVKALGDAYPEVEIRATDALVNFYLPGYIKTGLTASMKRAGTAIMSHFTDTNDQVIDPFVQVRPEVVAGLGETAGDGASRAGR